MAEREYEVTEPVVAANVFVVRARTRQEAIEKVANGEREYGVTTEAWPRRPLRVSDARLIRKPVPR